MKEGILYFEVAHIAKRTSKKAVAVRKNNGVVLTASNCYGFSPLQKSKRWNTKEKNQVAVDISFVVHKYNKFMGGTDQQDQSVGYLLVRHSVDLSFLG